MQDQFGLLNGPKTVWSYTPSHCSHLPRSPKHPLRYSARSKKPSPRITMPHPQDDNLGLEPKMCQTIDRMTGLLTILAVSINRQYKRRPTFTGLVSLTPRTFMRVAANRNLTGMGVSVGLAKIYVRLGRAICYEYSVRGSTKCAVLVTRTGRKGDYSNEQAVFERREISMLRLVGRSWFRGSFLRHGVQRRLS